MTEAKTTAVRNAAILAVGSEMLGPHRVDTNSLFLTEHCERFGIELYGKAVVGDESRSMVDLLRFYGERVDLLLVTGGLGPTADDMTRPAVAEAFGRSLAVDENVVEDLRRRFASYGIDMPDVNRRQAEIIENATLLHNPKGSAPGQRLRDGRCEVFLFPGVPREMRRMVEVHLQPWLLERQGTTVGIERRVLKVACLPESEVESRIAPSYADFGRQNIVVLASPGEVTIHALAQGDEAARSSRLDAMEQRLRQLVGAPLFADGQEDSLESVVGRLLLAADATVTTAESCTGGLVAERLTRVAGSSGFFNGAAVTYSNELKRSMLGVDGDAIERHGAVSETVARQMAMGVRQRLASDYGIGITGIAGPGGGSDAKPVGTVHVAVAGPGGQVEHRHLRLPGGRRQVRQQTSQWVLDMTRRMLLDLPQLADSVARPAGGATP